MAELDSVVLLVPIIIFAVGIMCMLSCVGFTCCVMRKRRLQREKEIARAERARQLAAEANGGVTPAPGAGAPEGSPETLLAAAQAQQQNAMIGTNHSGQQQIIITNGPLPRFLGIPEGDILMLSTSMNPPNLMQREPASGLRQGLPLAYCSALTVRPQMPPPPEDPNTILASAAPAAGGANGDDSFAVPAAALIRPSSAPLLRTRAASRIASVAAAAAANQHAAVNISDAALMESDDEMLAPIAEAAPLPPPENFPPSARDIDDDEDDPSPFRANPNAPQAPKGFFQSMAKLGASITSFFNLSVDRPLYSIQTRGHVGYGGHATAAVSSASGNAMVGPDGMALAEAYNDQIRARVRERQQHVRDRPDASQHQLHHSTIVANTSQRTLTRRHTFNASRSTTEMSPIVTRNPSASVGMNFSISTRQAIADEANTTTTPPPPPLSGFHSTAVNVLAGSARHQYNADGPLITVVDTRSNAGVGGLGRSMANSAVFTTSHNATQAAAAHLTEQHARGMAAMAGINGGSHHLGVHLSSNNGAFGTTPNGLSNGSPIWAGIPRVPSHLQHAHNMSLTDAFSGSMSQSYIANFSPNPQGAAAGGAAAAAAGSGNVIVNAAMIRSFREATQASAAHSAAYSGQSTVASPVAAHQTHLPISLSGANLDNSQNGSSHAHEDGLSTLLQLASPLPEAGNGARRSPNSHANGGPPSPSNGMSGRQSPAPILGVPQGRSNYLTTTNGGAAGTSPSGRNAAAGTRNPPPIALPAMANNHAQPYGSPRMGMVSASESIVVAAVSIP